MKKREKGGVIALFIFLTIFVFGGILIFAPHGKSLEAKNKILSEEYDPEKIDVEKIVLETGETYFSFIGISEVYADFIETKLEKEGIVFSEIESPDDYEEFLTPEEFEKISETVEVLKGIEGVWIKASEEEVLEFVETKFPEFDRELIKNAKLVEKEEIDEYILLEEL